MNELPSAAASSSGHKGTVLVVTFGWLNDAGPVLAVADGLARAGYRVVVCAQERHRGGVGAAFEGLAGDARTALQSDEAVAALHSAMFDQTDVLPAAYERHMDDNYARVVAAARRHRVDAIVWSLSAYGCLAVAQRLCVPAYCLATLPVAPSAELSSPLAAIIGQPLPAALDSLGRRLLFGEPVHRLRQRLGLPPAGYELPGLPCACIYSPLLQPDWPAAAVPLGSCPPLPAAEPPSSAALLGAFVDAGDAPVLCCFGAMPTRDLEQTVQLFDAALQLVHRRGIFCPGPLSGDQQAAGNLSLVAAASTTTSRLARPHLYIAGCCDHDWLLPRCCIAVHAGDSAATLACLRAGVPSVACPLLFDQHYWAARLAELGLGPSRPVELRALRSADQLVQLLRAADAAPVRANARRAAERLAAERGVANVVAWFERRFAADRGEPVAVDLQWKPDAAAAACALCHAAFSLFLWRKHCRSCGDVFCKRCAHKIAFMNYAAAQYCCLPCIRARFPRSPLLSATSQILHIRPNHDHDPQPAAARAALYSTPPPPVIIDL